MKKITESTSNYNDLDQMSVLDLLKNINQEDEKVAASVALHITRIKELVELIIYKINNGGRLFYIGAGTSGRLAVVDASECPPTFGVDHGVIIALIAGGDNAIRKAVEFAEDDYKLGWDDLVSYSINKKDVVLGIAASGTTPYVVGALDMCQKEGVSTACIVCNNNSPLATFSDIPIEVIVGPEFVTGSTRMKSGTAQKLILNMISTSVMVKLGRVKGNKMIDMQLANNKLVERGISILVNELSIDIEKAKNLLLTFGSVRNVIDNYNE